MNRVANGGQKGNIAGRYALLAVQPPTQIVLKKKLDPSVQHQNERSQTYI